ncbi:lyase family protein [Nocardioides sp. DS6]|uniref:Lyase family protein n=1 Tax=Nocardioides eburneus TaxID=3231482 RepID=A0ABV3SXY4_9ACTN
MNLLWPGDERAGDLFSDAAVLAAMVRVEEAWLDALVAGGIAPAGARAALAGLVGPADVTQLAEGAEGGGNPVIGLLRLLRSRLGEGEPATWLHRGLTSQDTVDTALVLCLRDCLDRVTDDVAAQARALARLADDHRATAMAGRTLTQHAVPITFGLKAAGWLDGLLLADAQLRRCRESLPSYAGGAAGTLSAVVELARVTPDPQATALAVVRHLTQALGLDGGANPWHPNRGALTQTADALVGLADVWGRIAGDVALLARPEIGELAEPAVAGRGGSSTMPHKSNPVLSVLLVRHARWAPAEAATLHVAAGSYTDERPVGSWHAEWDPLRLLARRSVVAASQAAELLAGLRVDVERMRVGADEESLRAEQQTMAGLIGQPPAPDYLGLSDTLVDAALERAAHAQKELS